MSLLLFDIDGTLCHSGQQIGPELKEQLVRLSKKHTLGLVGGGVYDKLVYQMDDILEIFTYIFSESGNTLHLNQDGSITKVYSRNMREQFGDKMIISINNILLKYLVDMDLPCKTGHFVDLRGGLIYFTPIGQNCTLDDRAKFKELDKDGVRIKTIKDLEQLFQKENLDLELTLGGEIGISVYPKGWDKVHCLDYIQNCGAKFDTTYYFGDKIFEYGNDYKVATDSRVTKYFNVNSLEETLEHLKTL